MSGNDLLAYSNSNALDPFFRQAIWQKPTDSPFQNRGWRSLTNHALRTRPIDPINGSVSYGGKATYRFDRSCFQRGTLQLKVVRSALTGQGGATFARFQDYEGYTMIEKVTMSYGQNLLYEISGDAMLLKHMKRHWLQKDHFDDVIFGNKSAAERNALAAAAQTLYVDLPLPHTVDHEFWLPQTALAHEVEINVYFRQLSAITQTDGASYPTASITQAQLISKDLHVMNDEKKGYLTQLTQSVGKNFRILEFEVQQERLAAGATVYNILLTSFKGACAELFVTIRTETQLSATLPTTNQDRTAYIPFGRIGLTSGSVVVIDEKDQEYIEKVENPVHHANLPGQNIYHHSFSIMDPMNPHIASGHKTWASMTTPKLTITFPAAAASNLIVDVYSLSNNIWSMSAGELKRLFQ